MSSQEKQQEENQNATWNFTRHFSNPVTELGLQVRGLGLGREWLVYHRRVQQTGNRKFYRKNPILKGDTFLPIEMPIFNNGSANAYPAITENLEWKATFPIPRPRESLQLQSIIFSRWCALGLLCCLNPQKATLQTTSRMNANLTESSQKMWWGCHLHRQPQIHGFPKAFPVAVHWDERPP